MVNRINKRQRGEKKAHLEIELRIRKLHQRSFEDESTIYVDSYDWMMLKNLNRLFRHESNIKCFPVIILHATMDTIFKMRVRRSKWWKQALPARRLVPKSYGEMTERHETRTPFWTSTTRVFLNGGSTWVSDMSPIRTFGSVCKVQNQGEILIYLRFFRI